MTLVPSFEQAIAEFNQREFYACHDTLEAIWLESSPADKNFYQGILQIAVGCYHLSNYNWRGAVILLGEGVRRLRDYQPSSQGIDVTGLMGQSHGLLEALQGINPDEVAQFSQSLNDSPQDGLPFILWL